MCSTKYSYSLINLSLFAISSQFFIIQRNRFTYYIILNGQQNRFFSEENV